MAKKGPSDEARPPAVRRAQPTVDPAEGVEIIRRLSALISAHLALEPVDWRAVARASRKLSQCANGCSRWRAPDNGAAQ